MSFSYVTCCHPEWDEPRVLKVRVLDTLQSEVGKELYRGCYLGEKYVGYCVLWEEGRYFVIRWDSPVKMEYFFYDDGVYRHRTMPPAKERCRVLIGILTCSACWERHARQQATWLRSLPKCCTYKYLVGSTDEEAIRLSAERDDVVVLPCSSHLYPFLPERVAAFHRWALGVPDWEWLMKTDDDCYCDIKQVLAKLTPDKECLAVSDESSGLWYGSGRVLRRDFVERLVTSDTVRLPTYGYEDTAVQAAYTLLEGTPGTGWQAMTGDSPATWSKIGSGKDFVQIKEK